MVSFACTSSVCLHAFSKTSRNVKKNKKTLWQRSLQHLPFSYSFRANAWLASRRMLHSFLSHVLGQCRSKAQLATASVVPPFLLTIGTQCTAFTVAVILSLLDQTAAQRVPLRLPLRRRTAAATFINTLLNSATITCMYVTLHLHRTLTVPGSTLNAQV